jgi:predicted neuraminidase
MLCFVVPSAHGLYQESWISPAGLFTANHAAAIVELPNQKLMACWYAGSREGGGDVQIYCAKKDVLSASWDVPTVVVPANDKTKGSWMKNKTVGNPTLFLDPEGILWMFYTSVQIGGWAGGKVDYKISKDLGQSWTQPQRLVDSFGNLTRTKPLLVSKNPVRFMLPLYHEFLSKQGYTCTLEVKLGTLQNSECHDIPGQNHIQPSLVNFNGKIFAYLRNNEKSSVLVSELNPQTQEWGELQKTNLPNPDSSVDAITADKQVLIVYNDHTFERSPLSLASSEDGINFKKIHDFEVYVPNKEFSYPAFIQLQDGSFQLAYSFDKRNAIKSVHFSLDGLGL